MAQRPPNSGLPPCPLASATVVLMSFFSSFLLAGAYLQPRVTCCRGNALLAIWLSCVPPQVFSAYNNLPGVAHCTPRLLV